MNQRQRKEIEAIRTAMDEQLERLADIASDEQDKADNLADNPGLEASDNGQRIIAAAEALGNAVCEFEALIGSLDEAIEA